MKHFSQTLVCLTTVLAAANFARGKRCSAGTRRTPASLAARRHGSFTGEVEVSNRRSRFLVSVLQDKTLYFGGDDGNIYAVDAASGWQLRKRATGGPVPSTPAVANGIVYR